MPELRRATLQDLDGLMELERRAFQPWRQANRSIMRRSLTSDRQSVWVLDERGIVGSLVLWHHPRTLRIYGVAVDPDHQGRGLGRRLMHHAESLAPGRVVLEADVTDRELVAWYEGLGYRKEARRPDYYGRGRHAWRMVKAS